MQERIWYLKSSDLLEMFDTDQLAMIERQSRWKKFQSGSPVFLPGEPADSIYIVADGLIKLGHLTPDGNVSTVAFVSVGEVFGELSLLESGRRDEYCSAALDSTIIRIPREVLMPFMEVNIRFVVAITKIVGFRRRRIENRLKCMLFSTNQQRLSHLLLDLAEQFGAAVDDGIRIGLKLSHQELANLIGTTRETVTIMLGKMKAEGLIGGKRQCVVIKDVLRLASSVGRDWQACGRVH
jgi:CRP/FNR family transcriptional regulator, cyclic AMP receptor protein